MKEQTEYVKQINMSETNELDKLAEKFKTDKCSKKVGPLGPKGYTIQYHKYLSYLRFKPIKILEIGVAKGASLKMWEAYFPDAKIYGVDIKPECKKYETERTKIFIGDQKNRAFLRSIIHKIDGPLDVVIDDGGHYMSQQLTSLEELFPYLRSGGVYVIEDLGTSYYAVHEGGYLKKDSTIEYLKRLIDDINEAHVYIRCSSFFRRFRARGLTGKLPEGLPTALERLESIHFYHHMAFLFAK